MWFGVISLFPEMFKALEYGITGKAIKNQLIQLHHFNLREYALDKHHSVDDKPYGGGPGMVLRAEPLLAAINHAKAKAPNDNVKVIYLSPQGPLFTQKYAQKMIEQKNLILVAGRYEGIDQRVIESVVDEECSIGNYILSGGELGAMVIIDSLARIIPGVVGDHNSVESDSLQNGLLKYPQYTRPEIVQGMAVPDILLSGNHQLIEKWRKQASIAQTINKRPDLLVE